MGLSGETLCEAWMAQNLPNLIVLGSLCYFLDLKISLGQLHLRNILNQAQVVHSLKEDYGNLICLSPVVLTENLQRNACGKNMKKSLKHTTSLFDGPLLDTVKTKTSNVIDSAQYPFSLNIIKNLKEIHFPTQVTFFVGENGSGKSTLLEAIALHAGFGAEGGSKNIAFKTSKDSAYSGIEKLANHLTLSWRQKPKDGYFFRADSFYNVANYIDYLEHECGGKAYDAYGGKSLHSQSHGESFLSFFTNRVGNNGFFILDEPEAALSPQRQLSLLLIIKQLCSASNTQFIIATHSPLLLAYPGATIYSCDDGDLKKIKYTETSHYKLTKDFLNNPDLYLENLFYEK